MKKTTKRKSLKGKPSIHYTPDEMAVLEDAVTNETPPRLVEIPGRNRQSIKAKMWRIKKDRQNTECQT